MPSSIGITIAGVERRYDAESVLAGIDLAIEPGECLALLGPSGCGKTTLLRLIAGLDRVDAGSISIGDRVMSSPTETVAPERRGVGMVFQDGALFPHLNVTRNVGFGLGRSERRGGARINELLELVGLPGYGDRMPDELSGGQAQRVALARALAPSPGVVLLDEPFSNLDAVLRRRLRDDVRSVIRAAGVTTVLVTHDRDEAFRLGDRVAVMRDGVIAQVDDPPGLYRGPRDQWIADSLGDTRWLDVEVVGSQVVSPFGPLDVSDRGDGPARLLVRPEDLVVVPVDHPDPGIISAVVVDATFAGSSWSVVVVTDAGSELVVEDPGVHTRPVQGSVMRIARREIAAVLVDRPPRERE